ncbi:hypothetical protein AVEN_213176-1 [Araneus ventricosus]|uniref:Uncharacterized protein n=1 Tax=Araneus ventricosus TaxID=182803 RepID=A0A4Y2I4L9_ARAVE|nr:hypothetical protein AVEN_213176-1 [Araneus ventricosus]
MLVNYSNPNEDRRKMPGTKIRKVLHTWHVPAGFPRTKSKYSHHGNGRLRQDTSIIPTQIAYFPTQRLPEEVLSYARLLPLLEQLMYRL